MLLSHPGDAGRKMSELEGFIGIRAFISGKTRFGRENSEPVCQVNKWIDIMLIHQQKFSFSASISQTYCNSGGNHLLGTH